jgi:hypothetical protein
VHVPRAASPQVVLGDAEAVGGGRHHVQPGQRLRVFRRGQQVAEGLLLASPHAAAQLVKLRQPETLGVFDDHDARGGHVHADLHHGRRDQDV